MKKNVKEPTLLSMLRQKQDRLNIHYLTTNSTFYKAFHIAFYILFGICCAINLLSALSWWGSLSSTLAVLENPTSVQLSAIAEVKDGIRTVIIFGILLIAAPLFSKPRKSVLALITTVIPSLILIFTYAERLSKNLDAGNYSFFVYLHLLPLGFLILVELILAFVELRQKYLDKKGMEELAGEIYEKYSAVAENISEEQWDELLKQYNPIPLNRAAKIDKKQKAKKN